MHQKTKQSIEYYSEVLHCLYDAVQRRQPYMWTGKNWKLHDNAPEEKMTTELRSISEKSSRAVSKSGISAEKVCTCKGSILKEIKQNL